MTSMKGMQGYFETSIGLKVRIANSITDYPWIVSATSICLIVANNFGKVVGSYISTTKELGLTVRTSEEPQNWWDLPR